MAVAAGRSPVRSAVLPTRHAVIRARRPAQGRTEV